jgi:serine/threonine-protein kinase HipA
MNGRILDVRLDGFSEPIGKLSGEPSSNTTFKYEPTYLKIQNAIPLSLSLPLTDEPYDDVLTRNFFNNLLQERDAPLDRIMEREGIVRDDIIGLLYHLGQDCAGAISVLPEGAPPTKVPGDLTTDYLALSQQELNDIIAALYNREPLPGELQDPSPLAGVQSKISLTLLPSQEFALPKPGTGAPTTHILKIPDRNHPKDAQLEVITLGLASICGMNVVKADLLKSNELEAICVPRYDRQFDQDGRIVRLHQEDFAQALGLAASLKYERNGKTGRKFDVLAIRQVLDKTIDPALSKSSFIQATIFDLIVGNVDAHAKNHALLYLTGGRAQLSPRYDILPTRLDPQFTDELSYNIGEAKTLNGLTLADLDSFLNQLGIGTTRGRQRILQTTLTSQSQRLAENLESLRQHKLFADLIASNIRRLCDIVGVDVPPQALNRDAFVVGGGGWS